MATYQVHFSYPHRNAKATRFGDRLTFDGETATLTLTDNLFNLDYIKSAQGLIDGTVKTTGNVVSDRPLTFDDIEDISTVMTTVEVTSENKNVVVGNRGQEDAVYRTTDLGVGAVNLGSANAVTVTDGKTLTLVGKDAEFVKSTASNVTVTVENGGTLVLGDSTSEGGTFDGTLTVDGESTVRTLGANTVTLGNVEGEGNLLVGDENTASNVVFKNIDKFSGLILLDPLVANNFDETSSGIFGNALTSAKVAAGNNGVAVFGGDKATAKSAFEKLAELNDLTWGNQVTSAAYVDSTLTLGDEAGVLIDATATSDSNVTAKTVTVGEKGLLMVNQPSDATTAVVDGDVVLQSGSYLGVLNASEGEFTLASGNVGADASAKVITDNPFVDAEIQGNKVQASMNAAGGLAALASTGIQATTRRADTILAQTIADRTSFNQDLHAGVNLWADVTAERYEADKLQNGGSFKADTGYGAFGGDVAITNDVVVGGAFQYGDGSVRSSVSSIKNDIKSYGITAYGSKAFDQLKLVGEMAYLQQDNKITSSQTALNQKVDSKIYSLGMRVQYQLQAGAFQFVPSIGVRYSRLETDSMKVGKVAVAKQKQDLVQLPISLRVSGVMSEVNGWELSPSFKVSFVPTFGDKEIKVLGYEQDVIDTTPVQGDFGLLARKGNLLLNANVMIGGGKDGTSSVGGKVGVKYAF